MLNEMAMNFTCVVELLDTKLCVVREISMYDINLVTVYSVSM